MDKKIASKVYRRKSGAASKKPSVQANGKKWNPAAIKDAKFHHSVLPSRGTQIESGDVAAPDPQIFKGCVINISYMAESGVSDLQLKKDIIRHGGRISRMITAGVTHVIAKNFAAGKHNRVISRAVSVSWALDSLKEGRRKSEAAYRLRDDASSGGAIQSRIIVATETAPVSASPSA